MGIFDWLKEDFGMNLIAEIVLNCYSSRQWQ